jgi:hypothetical protein
MAPMSLVDIIVTERHIHTSYIRSMSCYLCVTLIAFVFVLGAPWIFSGTVDSYPWATYRIVEYNYTGE